MLLQLENASQEKIDLLLNFAKENNLQLELIDEGANNYYLPGRALFEDELSKLIETSRNSGIVSMEDAHNFIRENFHGN